MSNLGGARDGAGRPPLPVRERRVQICIRLKPALMKQVRVLAKSQGESLSSIVETLLDEKISAKAALKK